jgi:hypothetical protein
MGDENKDKDVNVAPKSFSLKMALATGTAIVAFIASTLGLWFTIDKQIKSAVTSSTIQITKEIKRSTYDVIELHKDDLTLRTRILQREIDASISAGEPVPERKLIQLQTYRDQLNEIKDRWKNYQ